MIKLGSTGGFSQKDECFLCEENFVDETKLPKHRRGEMSSFMTLSLEKLHSKFEETDNDFVQSVKDRFERIKASCSDMPSAESKYHRDCYSCFLNSGCKVSERKGKSGRPNDTIKNRAFEKLMEFLEENDKCQYLLSDLHERMNSFITDSDESYGLQYLKQRLINHYRERVIITEIKGVPSIASFKDQAHKLLQEKWNENNSDIDEKKIVIEMADSYIRDSIRSKPFSLEKYPDLNSLNHAILMQDIPEELHWLLDGIIMSKNPKNDTIMRRKCAISHVIMSSCWPRSFLSPLLLSLAIYVHKRHESRELIDILCSLGFGGSYDEVTKFIEYIPSAPSSCDKMSDISLNAFVQFVFDNADWNTRNATGNNTWHVMGGIASISPRRETPQAADIERLKLNINSSDGNFISVEDIPSGRIREPPCSAITFPMSV